MMNKDQLACVERSIRDLMSGTGHPLAQLPFGGKIVVFAGDFWQVLPVASRRTCKDCLNDNETMVAVAVDSPAAIDTQHANTEPARLQYCCASRICCILDEYW